MEPKPRNLTMTVALPGGQRRIREAILYVSHRCAGSKFFGSVKLNKIIWKADFDSFAERGIPVTGRTYKRRYFGPALNEMLPVHREMLKDGLVAIEPRDFGDGFVENRTVALVKADLSIFSAEDISFIEASIQYYWDKTGGEASDDSHGAAWSTRNNNDPMPYELAYLSDKPLNTAQMARAERLIYEKGLASE